MTKLSGTSAMETKNFGFFFALRALFTKFAVSK